MKLQKELTTYIKVYGDADAVAEFNETFNRPLELWETKGIVDPYDPQHHRGMPDEYGICIDPTTKKGWTHQITAFPDSEYSDIENIFYMIKFIIDKTGLDIKMGAVEKIAWWSTIWYTIPWNIRFRLSQFFNRFKPKKAEPKPEPEPELVAEPQPKPAPELVAEPEPAPITDIDDEDLPF